MGHRRLRRRPGLALLAALLAAWPAGCAANPPRSDDDPGIAPEPRLRTFLMFEGRAGEALELYVSLFPDGRVIDVERYGPGEAGPEGTVRLARFELLGQELLCIDSPAPHPFTFTPSISLFVTCASEAELERLFAALSQDGQVLMPLDAYGFSRRFAWVADRFGVSWQLNLP